LNVAAIVPAGGGERKAGDGGGMFWLWVKNRLAGSRSRKDRIVLIFQGRHCTAQSRRGTVAID
jgi:hypothetical protein